MESLTIEQNQKLIQIVDEDFGVGLTRDEFGEAVLSLFENIPGFETVSPDQTQAIVNQLWRIYMGKNPAPEATQPPTEKKPDAQPVAIENILKTPALQTAIKQGKTLIAESKTKADAARAMYALIHDQPKEVIVAAFVDGAGLTEKGALTYWYNCKRRASKEKKTATT